MSPHFVYFCAFKKDSNDSLAEAIAKAVFENMLEQINEFNCPDGHNECVVFANFIKTIQHDKMMKVGVIFKVSFPKNG